MACTSLDLTHCNSAHFTKWLNSWSPTLNFNLFIWLIQKTNIYNGIKNKKVSRLASCQISLFYNDLLQHPNVYIVFQLQSPRKPHLPLPDSANITQAAIELNSFEAGYAIPRIICTLMHFNRDIFYLKCKKPVYSRIHCLHSKNVLTVKNYFSYIVSKKKMVHNCLPWCSIWSRLLDM